MRRGAIRAALLVAAGLVIWLAQWLMRSDVDAANLRTSPSAGAAAQGDGLRALPESGSKPTLPEVLESESVATIALDSAERPGEALRLLGRIVDETHRPIPDALVQHWPTRRVRRQLGLQDAGVAGKPIPWERLSSTRTGADGRFTLVTRDDVLRGQVFAQTSNQSVDTSLDWQEGRPLIVVQHPEHETTACIVKVAAPGDVDLGDIVMGPGTVLLGRVVTRHGEPLADVQVDLVDYTGQRFNQDVSRALLCRCVGGRTAADGRFRIPGLWSGRFMMFMDAPGTMPDAHPFEIEHAGEVDLGDILQDAGGRIEGHVVDAEGRAVPGATVRMQPVTSWDVAGGDGAALLWRAGVSTSGREFGAETATGSDGSFSLISHMDSDHHDVIARAEGLDPDFARDVAAGRNDLVLRLQSQARWTLHIVDAEGGGQLTDASVRGLRHADSTDENVSELSAEPVEGGWLLRGASQLRTTVIVAAQAHATQDFDLPGLPAGVAREQVLRLPREAELVGRVTDEDGAPWPAARVHVAATGPASDAIPPRELLADSQGRFRVGGLRAGEWDLSATAPDALPMFQPRRLALQVGAQGEADLVLRRGATITGLLLDTEGLPLLGAPLQATTTSQEALAALEPPAEALAAATPGQQVMTSSTFTGPDGRFELGGLPPGKWRLDAREGAIADVVLAPRAAVEITLQRPRPARLRGRVTRSGQPEPHAMVELGNGLDTGSEWHTLVRVQADDLGNYVIEHLAAEEAYLHATDGLSASAPIRVELVPGQEQVVDLAMPTGHVRGIVVALGSGEPVEHATLRLSDSQRKGVESMETMTTSEGHFDFDRVPAGTWLVEAQADMYCKHDRADVTLAEGAEAVDVRFELAPAGVVLVNLDGLAESGEALRVVLEPSGGMEPQSEDAEAGQTLELSSVPPGSYWLSVRQRGTAGSAELYRQVITVVAGQTLDVRAPLGG